MVKRGLFGKLRGWWFGTLGLAACSDAPATSGPTATSAPTLIKVEATAQTTNTVAPALTERPTAPAIVPTSQLEPSATAIPALPTLSPTSTPTPFEPSWKALGLVGGYDFSFAADGRLVYYDKPADDNRAGSWALNLQNGPRQYLTAGFGLFSSDLTLAALSNRAAGSTTLEDLANGRRLATLSNRASPTLFAPAKKQVAYLLRSLQQEGAEAPQRFELWLAGVEGGNARAVWQGRELANLAWFPDSQRLLLTGRDLDNRRFGLWIINGTTGAVTFLVESKGLTVAALSGDGQWIAWWIALQGPERSGLWLARADGSQARRLNWVGGFRWSPQGSELFYLPARSGGAAGSALWSYDPLTNQTTRLTDLSRLPLRVALDQWQIGPDGKIVVFRNAVDNTLWQLNFR